MLSAVFLPLGLASLLGLFACAPVSHGGLDSVQASEGDPGSDGAENVRLVGYNDLQGREVASAFTSAPTCGIEQD